MVFWLRLVGKSRRRRRKVKSLRRQLRVDSTRESKTIPAFTTRGVFRTSGRQTPNGREWHRRTFATCAKTSTRQTRGNGSGNYSRLHRSPSTTKKMAEIHVPLTKVRLEGLFYAEFKIYRTRVLL